MQTKSLCLLLLLVAVNIVLVQAGGSCRWCSDITGKTCNTGGVASTEATTVEDEEVMENFESEASVLHESNAECKSSCDWIKYVVNFSCNIFLHIEQGNIRVLLVPIHGPFTNPRIAPLDVLTIKTLCKLCNKVPNPFPDTPNCVKTMASVIVSKQPTFSAEVVCV